MMEFYKTTVKAKEQLRRIKQQQALFPAKILQDINTPQRRITPRIDKSIEKCRSFTPLKSADLSNNATTATGSRSNTANQSKLMQRKWI
jgi:hypothetical protein